MCRPFASLILALGLLPAAAGAQNKAGSAKPPAKAVAMTPEIAKKLYEIGYPAVGDNAEQAVLQWRSRGGRKTIGPLNAEEAAAIQREPIPSAFGAYLGDPFRGYGVATRQTSRAEAMAVALEDCRKSSGPTCEAGRQIVFTGKRCIALAGYKDQVGADGKMYTAFSPFVGDTAEIASATAVRNCATDADGQKYCKPVLVECADGSTSLVPTPAPPTSVAAPAAVPVPIVPPAKALPATPPPATAPSPPTASAAAPSLAEIASKLFVLGFPVSGKASDAPAAAISQWRFRMTGKPSRDPLTSDEIQAIMSAPRPAAYGAFAGATFSGFGLASQSPSRAHAEREALERCEQAKGTDCDKALPMVVAGTRCIAYAGYGGALKADGQTHTLSASGLADDPAIAMQTAMSRCSQQPDNAPLCKPLVAVCADGRQLTPVAAQTPAAPVAPPLPAPASQPAPTPIAPVATPATTPAPTPTTTRPRVSAEVMNKLFDLGFPFSGRPYDEPAIAIGQWRAQGGTVGSQAVTGTLTDAETAAILATPMPGMFVGFAGDPFGIHGLALQRASRAKAEVDAIAACRQKRGNCDDAAHVVAEGRCLAFSGFKDETGAKPRRVFYADLGATAAVASERAMRRCTEKPADAALCKPLLRVCGDTSVP